MSNIIYYYCLQFELKFKSTFCAKLFDQIIGRVDITILGVLKLRRLFRRPPSLHPGLRDQLLLSIIKLLSASVRFLF